MNVVESKFKTIGVKYLSATNTRGARVKAYIPNTKNKIVRNWNYALDNENYCEVAKELAEKMGWGGELIGGFFKNEMVFVFKNFEVLSK